MNKKKLIAISALLLNTFVSADFLLDGVSMFTPRSQTTNAARDLVGECRFEHTMASGFVGAASIAFEYSRSFRPRRIAEYFFGTEFLRVTGSQVLGRFDDDLLADYFGLSPEFSSTLVLHPVMSNVITDFSVFFQYNCWYFRAHAPLSVTRTRIKIDEFIEDNGADNPFPAGYMAPGVVEPPYFSWAAAMMGGASFGDVQPLNFGKITCHGCHEVKVAEVQMKLGYDLVKSEVGYAGFNLMGSIPTGTRPNSRFIFEPIVGNGHHGELGVGFDSRVLCWSKDADQTCYFYATFNATHLFSTTQHRSFDFLNNFGSRYILFKEFDDSGLFDGTVLPGINATTLPCKVSVACQLDFVFMFDYNYRNWGFDIGYNGWVRSHENICLDKSIFPNNRYAFKGIQNAVGQATESSATLHGDPFTDQALVRDIPSPVFLNNSNLNPESAASNRMMTHKIFWFGSYAWEDRFFGRVAPYFGVGGEVEFEGERPKEERPNKNSMAQWGMWVKGGFGW